MPLQGSVGAVVWPHRAIQGQIFYRYVYTCCVVFVVSCRCVDTHVWWAVTVPVMTLIVVGLFDYDDDGVLMADSDGDDWLR